MPVRPVDIGFAEFVATLLSETVDSVVASATEQEERLRTLREATTLSPAIFAASYVDDGEVERLAAALFPSNDGSTEIVVGGKVPSKAALVDLEIELDDGDVEGTKLTASGVDAILAGLRSLMAGQRQIALRAAVETGLPRVIVDDGRILAKLTMQILADDNGDSDSGGEPAVDAASTAASVSPDALGLAASAARPLTTIEPQLPGRLFALGSLNAISTAALAATIPSVIKDLRLSVHPATVDDAANDASASVFGEVELNFRTIY